MGRDVCAVLNQERRECLLGCDLGTCNVGKVSFSAYLEMLLRRSNRSECSFRGVTLAPLDALFADSVKTAKRSKYQVRKYVATLAGATIGPILAVVLFRNFGDAWTKNELRVVISAGTAFAIIPLLSLFIFDDNHSLDEQTSGPLLSLQDEMNDINSRRIRILCFAADLLGGLASGMSIKFFPLFFRDKTKLSPGEVNTVTIVTTFLMIFGSTFSQKLAKRFGRMPTIVAYKFVGITLLFIMALKKDIWSEWEIIIPIYVVRTVLMNATSPLHKAVLMDHCGKKERARWSALDSVVSFGWSGSALIGGLLADKHGFGYTFLITAILQFVGFLCLCALAFIVDDHADDVRLAAEEAAALNATAYSVTSERRDRTGSGVLVADDVSGTFVHTDQSFPIRARDHDDVDTDLESAGAEYRLIDDQDGGR